MYGLLLEKGAVGAEHAFSGTSWTALTLEVGKSPTEVPPRRRLPVSPCPLAARGTSVGDLRVRFVVEP